ncbi:group I intron-associated PD-(D/E)XK endonuclease [Halorussus limi]|uniref:Group I intron-associated PD-(D/E)XK endonuclease n=1 Tax=Halorussus limi TaxID=2938695 RepID=A0A8U0HZQ9_9EURY|nr:group I intron-associated PD-(D/E)XK endonuclease [Halorussus limi]UPV76176.1 group I intron-associated PD-(D/E)XK endonuclease [Halorussus limi]
MNPSRKGDETEATILGRLMQAGVSVSVPFGDSDRYDLVVDDRTRRYRVQCKTGSWVDGTVRFNLYSSTTDSEGRVDADYTPDEIDAYAVYSPDTDSVYWVPIEATGSGEMRLRVEDHHPKVPKSRINWASEYALSNRFE